MTILAVVVASFALVIALLARSKAGGLVQRIEDAEREAKRRAEGVGAELGGELETLRRLVAELAAGRAVDQGMVLEGRLWRDVDAAEGKRLFESNAARWLDVRTGSEVARGRIPGALHIPLDDLEERCKELPRDGRLTLVYCAGGGRSQAACEFLSMAGFANLRNLEGGIQAWSGPVERSS